MIFVNLDEVLLDRVGHGALRLSAAGGAGSRQNHQTSPVGQG